MFYPVIAAKLPFRTARFFILLSLLSSSLWLNSAQANDQASDSLVKVYKVIGEDGSVSFSDQPNEKSETVMVPPVPTIPAITPSKTTLIPKKVKPVQDQNSYDSLSIIAPANDSAFYSGSGDVNVLLEIKPALIEGDQIKLFLDGKLINSNNQIQTSLPTVDRGTHELRVKLISSSGEMLKEASSSFTVHRPSIRN